ncbi:ImmA/IrrE family metallo-endopeptidase [Paludibaculum fermentans]|uniref:ImmA/IrrE family metallo-endopeptidase n=1 Tax=Paludibaculum fermentans TaxID=1473598 RepID=A0A7S7NVX1_PALFE|nr:ImmA/IrrE family metallo-endopeptidase [Paludibaculum fermentans]QOY90783.1 ImmA/IrrE family metallo-endopeptidase [Paludibaculum fermentans]
MKYNPAMVTLARESRGLTQSELAEKAGLPQGTLSKLESGALVLSDDVVKSFSRVLLYPSSFFQQTDPVYPFGSSTFYHRKQQSVPASILKRIEAKINIYRGHIVRLLRATNVSAQCRFRRSDPDEYGGRIEEIAGLTRAAWRLQPGPIANLVRVVEGAGGIIVRFNFETSKMFGLSEWVPPAPPLFFINSNPEISADRDRFTLAHEIGHVLLHDLPNPNMENEANRFAGELLMPETDIRAHLIPPIKLHTVARLKPFWKVSMAALIERARELDVVNHNQYVYLRMQLQQKGYRHREPVELDIQREQPSLLSEIIEAHLGQLGYSIDELAEMVNIHTDEFKEYHGIAPQGRHGLRVIRKS